MTQEPGAPPETRLAIGIDLGGTHLRAAVVDGRGHFLASVRQELIDKSPQGVLSSMADMVGSFDASHQSLPIGVGLAALLWLEEGMPKIVVRVPDEQALLQLAEQAHRIGLPTLVVQDAGKTVLPAGTTTCLGIGPAPDEELDHLTGTLPLL